MAGTAACPSETGDTPATVSRSWERLAGWRTRNSRAGSTTAALPGVPSMPGAAPAVTVTVSWRTATTRRRVPPSPPGRDSTGIGLITRPPGRTTSTSNGTGGSGRQEKRPSASVRATPLRPRTDTSAPAIGEPSGRRTWASNEKAADGSAAIAKEARARRAVPGDMQVAFVSSRGTYYQA